jgi:hypothetical protein
MFREMATHAGSLQQALPFVTVFVLFNRYASHLATVPAKVKNILPLNHTFP